MKYKREILSAYLMAELFMYLMLIIKKKNTKLAILKRKEHYLPLKRMKYL